MTLPQRMPAGLIVYTVSKAVLEALTRVLARDKGQKGLRVNAPLNPDWTRQ